MPLRTSRVESPIGNQPVNPLDRSPSRAESFACPVRPEAAFHDAGLTKTANRRAQLGTALSARLRRIPRGFGPMPKERSRPDP